MDSFLKGMLGFVFCFAVMVIFYGIFELAGFVSETKAKLRNVEWRMHQLETQNDETIQKQLDRDINPKLPR